MYVKNVTPMPPSKLPKQFGRMRIRGSTKLSPIQK